MGRRAEDDMLICVMRAVTVCNRMSRRKLATAMEKRDAELYFSCIINNTNG